MCPRTPNANEGEECKGVSTRKEKKSVFKCPVGWSTTTVHSSLLQAPSQVAQMKNKQTNKWIKD